MHRNFDREVHSLGGVVWLRSVHSLSHSDSLVLWEMKVSMKWRRCKTHSNARSVTVTQVNNNFHRKGSLDSTSLFDSWETINHICATTQHSFRWVNQPVYSFFRYLRWRRQGVRLSNALLSWQPLIKAKGRSIVTEIPFGLWTCQSSVFSWWSRQTSISISFPTRRCCQDSWSLLCHRSCWGMHGLSRIIGEIGTSLKRSVFMRRYETT